MPRVVREGLELNESHHCADNPSHRPHEEPALEAGSRSARASSGDVIMGKGNNSQKNDKKSMKPKQDKKKPAPKK